MNNGRRALLVLLCALITTAFASATAHAGSYSLAPCWDPSADFDLLGFANLQGSAFSLTTECPDIDITSVPADDNDRGVWTYPVHPGLTSVAASVAGGPLAGSGVTVRLRVCSLDLCGRPISPSADGSLRDDTLTADDGIPDQPLVLQIDATCTASLGCGQQPATTFSALRLNYIDEKPPTISFADANGELLDGDGAWTQDPVFVNFQDGDSESFIARRSVQFGDQPPEVTSCPQLADGAYDGSCRVDTGGLDLAGPSDLEGEFPVTVTITDAAGNEATATRIYRHDDVPPGAPADLTVGQNAAGWVGSPDVDVAWTNPPGPGGAAADSPIVHARWVLRDAAGDVIKSGDASGSGIDSLPLRLSNGDSYALSVAVDDAAGNQGDWSTVDFNYDDVKPVAPGLNGLSLINQSTAADPYEIGWSDVTYNMPWFSGICSRLFTIDGQEHEDPLAGDPGVMVLPASTMSQTLSTGEVAALSEGPHYVHVRNVSCVGTPGDTSDGTILVDRIAPTITSVPASGGWLPAGGKLKIAAHDDDPSNSFAGIAELDYSVDGGDWVHILGSTTSVPIGQGMHVIRALAMDHAGNLSAYSTISVGTDSVPPTAAFEAMSPGDPTLIRADVNDPDSGVDDAWIEYSPPGSGSWARLVGDSSGTGASRTVSAHMPDDASLPPGVYGLRVVARDKAGNVSTTSSWTDGEAASVTLPLRPHPTLSLAVSPGPGKPAVASLLVPFGSSPQALGALRDSSGAPLAGAAVAISQSVEGGAPVRIGVATTGSDGGFAITVPPGSSRTLTAQFFGDAVHAAASASATFNVRGSITLGRLPSAVRSRKLLYLRGRVDPGPVALPRQGALVSIQHRSGRRWSGFAINLRTASDGSFAYPWRVRTHGRRIAMTFRVVVEADPGWPFADGYSRIRKVVFG